MTQNSEVGAIQGARFGRAMQGWGQGIEAMSVVNGESTKHSQVVDTSMEFPWNDLPNGAIINDIGGGVGFQTMAFAKAHPHLQYILQDLPQTIRQAEAQVWPTQAPEPLKAGNIQFKPIDFFKESPVPDCDIYYVSSCHIIKFTKVKLHFS